MDAQSSSSNCSRSATRRPARQPELIFLYDRILRLDPDRHAIRREALAACLKIGRYSDAVTHAEALLKAFPNEAALWQQLGSAQAGLNRLADAKQVLRDGRRARARRDPGLPAARAARLAEHERHAGARGVLDRMVTALPQSADAHLIRGAVRGVHAEDPATAVPRRRRAGRCCDLQPRSSNSTPSTPRRRC